jgi:hypothetical protein
MKLACAIALLCAGCWGSKHDPAKPPGGGSGSSTAKAYEITMSRTPCMGMCPIYTVSIGADGAVKYRGDKGVSVTGEQRGTADPVKLAALGELIRKVEFFSLDEKGRLHPKPECRPSVKSADCDRTDDVACSDTSSTIIEIAHAGKKGRIALEHCEALPADALEAAIDDAARTAPWVLGPQE